MTKRMILLPSISGIAASSAIGTVGTFDLPIGYRYHKIEFVYIDGGDSPTDILALLGDITVFRNTIQERIHTASELDHLNGLNNTLGDTTYNRQQIGTGAAMVQTLSIYFNEPWRKNPSQADGLAWSVDGPNGWNSFQIKLALLAAMPSTGSIVARALVDSPLAPPATGTQAIKKVYRQQFPASGTQIDITTLDQRDAYQVLALKHPSTTAYITTAWLKQNGTSVIEQISREGNIGHLINANMNPANSTSTGAFGYDIVLDFDDPINSALPGVALWLELTFSTAASGNVVALIERLGQFD